MEIELHHTRHGKFYHISDDAGVGSHLRRYGEWAESEILLMSRLVRPGDWALDVGGHVGTHAVPMSKLVGPAGRVLSFEAHEFLHSLLAANCINNGCTNVSSIRCMVSNDTSLFWDRIGDVPTGSRGNSGEVSYLESERGPPSLVDRAPLPMVRLDDLGLTRCNFIKVDVEGMELAVLEGAINLVKSHRPMFLVEQVSNLELEEKAARFDSFGYDVRIALFPSLNSNNFKRFAVEGGAKQEIGVVAIPRDRNEIWSHIEELPIEMHSIADAKEKIHQWADAIVVWNMPSNAYAGTLLEYSVSDEPILASHDFSAISIRSEGDWVGSSIPIPTGLKRLRCSFRYMAQSVSGPLELQVLLRTGLDDKYLWLSISNEWQAEESGIVEFGAESMMNVGFCSLEMCNELELRIIGREAIAEIDDIVLLY